jgi:D-lactate dehydrogenase (cytochrome)
MMTAISRFGDVSFPLPEQDSIFFKFQGSSDVAMDESVRIVSEISKKYGGAGLTFAKDDAQSEELWRARKAAHWSCMALVPGGTAYSTDVCVPVSNLPRLVKETQEDLRANGIVGPLLG